MFNKVSGPHGDGSSYYTVQTSRECSVQEVVDYAVAREKEWGYIGIDNGSAVFGDPCCEYKWGSLLSSLPAEVLDKPVGAIQASGGWSRMDFMIELH